MKFLKSINDLQNLSVKKLNRLGVAVSVMGAIISAASMVINNIDGNLQTELTYRDFRDRLVKDGFIYNQHI